MSSAVIDASQDLALIEDQFSIRYEGGHADEHMLELNQLGQSLQGFARVLAVCAHMANTGKYNKQYDALSVRVYAAPVQEHHCYEVLTIIKDIALSKELWSGFGGVAVTLLAQYVFGRRSAEEMKYLSEALKQSLGQNASMTDRLLTTIDRMAEALQPAAKQAMAPVGTSCESIGLYKPGDNKPFMVLDQGTKDALNRPFDYQITEIRTYMGLISEMDMETGHCRVTVQGLEGVGRINATITDPVGRTANNPYALAMAHAVPLAFSAKAEMDPDGNIVRLYISDLAKTAA